MTDGSGAVDAQPGRAPSRRGALPSRACSTAWWSGSGPRVACWRVVPDGRGGPGDDPGRRSHRRLAAGPPRGPLRGRRGRSCGRSRPRRRRPRGRRRRRSSSSVRRTRGPGRGPAPRRPLPGGPRDGRLLVVRRSEPGARRGRGHRDGWQDDHLVPRLGGPPGGRPAERTGRDDRDPGRRLAGRHRPRDDAGRDRAPAAAPGDGRRRRSGGGPRDDVPRPGRGSGRWDRLRRGDLHQPQPRASRVPRVVRGVPGGQARSLRAARPSATAQGRPLAGGRRRQPRRPRGRPVRGGHPGRRGPAPDLRARSLGRRPGERDRRGRPAAPPGGHRTGLVRVGSPCAWPAGSTSTTPWPSSPSGSAGGSTRRRSGGAWRASPGSPVGWSGWIAASRSGWSSTSPTAPRRSRPCSTSSPRSRGRQGGGLIAVFGSAGERDTAQAADDGPDRRGALPPGRGHRRGSPGRGPPGDPGSDRGRGRDGRTAARIRSPARRRPGRGDRRGVRAGPPRRRRAARREGPRGGDHRPPTDRGRGTSGRPRSRPWRPSATGTSPEVRGCLLTLIALVAVVAALLWLALPPLAGTLVQGALVAGGLEAASTVVTVTADPPPRLLTLKADEVDVHATNASIHGLSAADLEVTLHDVDLLDRTFSRLDGTLRGVRLSDADGDGTGHPARRAERDARRGPGHDDPVGGRRPGARLRGRGAGDRDHPELSPADGARPGPDQARRPDRRRPAGGPPGWLAGPGAAGEPVQDPITVLAADPAPRSRGPLVPGGRRRAGPRGVVRPRFGSAD